MAAISTLLIANRGEIAVRIIRAAKDAGFKTVAVYADQDMNALFVHLADEAYSLDGHTPHETYLVPEKILSIAKRSRASAIHPGYGFLSENAEFAQMVMDAGLIWVGPPPSAIKLLGDKVSARRVAQKVGAPLAPGTANFVTSAAEVVAFAEEYGVPVAIKAAHGGGGRGLKVAYTLEEIPEQFDSATREALAAFGRGECFVEKYLEKPRHVETQCLADANGKVVVISTRDCSLQRRNQKLVEEAPAPFLTSEQEDTLYRSSKAILKEAGYVNAGTCEFLIAKDGTISFLEVNTRLQVEHPVSEEVTGIDLVREQFRIAEGGILDYEDPQICGHSIEFRINGEDAGSGFLPTPGKLTSARFPSGPGVRVDSGITGSETISGFFDSLLAKLVVTGRDRKEAIERSRRALAEIEFNGLPTLVPFHKTIIDDADFCGTHSSGFVVHTSWIETEFANDIEPWGGPVDDVSEAEETFRRIVVEVEGRRMQIRLPQSALASEQHSSGLKAPKRALRRRQDTAAGSDIIASPMQARVVKLHVAVGDAVLAFGPLVTIEAMKMEQTITAPRDVRINKIMCLVGDSVAAGQTLVTVM